MIYLAEEIPLFWGHWRRPFAMMLEKCLYYWGRSLARMPHAADSGFRIHSSSTKEAGISSGGATTIFAQSIQNHSRSRYQIFRSFLENSVLQYLSVVLSHRLLRQCWLTFYASHDIKFFTVIPSPNNSVNIFVNHCSAANSKVSYTRLAPNEVRPGKQVLKSLRFALCRPPQLGRCLVYR